MSHPPLKPKAAAITSVIVNGINTLLGLWQLFMVFGISPQAYEALQIKSLLALVALVFLAGAAYSLVVGVLMLNNRSRSLWMSGAVVALIIGPLGFLLMFPLLIGVPVAIWLIVAIRRSRSAGAANAPVGETSRP